MKIYNIYDSIWYSIPTILRSVSRVGRFILDRFSSKYNAGVIVHI